MFSDHPLLNVSLAVCVGLACTIATSLAVAYGVHYVIKEHNTSQIRRILKQRQRELRLTLRHIEEECNFILASKIADAKAQVSCLELTCPNTTRLNGSDIVDTTNTKLEKKLKGIEEELIRVLESLDAVKPTYLQLNEDDSLLKELNPESSAVVTDYRLVLETERFFIQSRKMDSETLALIKEAVESVRKKKKTLTKKAQAYLAEVDHINTQRQEVCLRIKRCDSKLDPDLPKLPSEQTLLEC